MCGWGDVCLVLECFSGGGFNVWLEGGKGCVHAGF